MSNTSVVTDLPPTGLGGRVMPIRLVILLTALLVGLELLIGTLYPATSKFILTVIALQLIVLVVSVSMMGRKYFKSDSEFKRDCARSCKTDDK